MVNGDSNDSNYNGGSAMAVVKRHHVILLRFWRVSSNYLSLHLSACILFLLAAATWTMNLLEKYAYVTCKYLG